MIHFLLKFRLHLQRSVVSHRRVGGFSDSSFLGLYSVDKVSAEFSFSVPRLVVFGKHIKSVGRRVGIDFSQPRNGGAKDERPFSDASDRAIAQVLHGTLAPPLGGEGGRGGDVRWSDEKARHWLQGKVNVSVRSFLHLFLLCSNS